MYILLKVFLNFGEIYYLRYDGRYRSLSTKSHGASSQEAADFTQTPVDTAKIKKEECQCMLRLHPKCLRHIK